MRRLFQGYRNQHIAGHEGVDTTLVLKATNLCPMSNSVCNNNAHFDVAAHRFDSFGCQPGNTCDQVGGDQLDGFQSCGRWMIVKIPTRIANATSSPTPFSRRDAKTFLVSTGTMWPSRTGTSKSPVPRSSRDSPAGKKWTSLPTRRNHSGILRFQFGHGSTHSDPSYQLSSYQRAANQCSSYQRAAYQCSSD